MIKTKYFAYAGIVCAVLAACSEIPKEAYFERGEPEGLLDVSSEVVDLRIESPASVREIANWVNQDQPTRAELNCPDGDMLCTQVQGVLHQFGVPVKYSATADNNVMLVYERVQARDCENRYIDNTVNPYNLNHPTFGCSLAVNNVMMVSDKRQFTSPALMDYSDGLKSVQVMGNYKAPASFSPSKVDTNFTDLATQESIQSSSGR